MKKIIAVIGNANIENDIEKQNISFELGKLIIDNGYLLATGGFGGVMEFASKGARSSKKYSKSSIIGVLPDYNAEAANNYIDIAIPTGFGLARNLILISMSNAVIAVGGGSGTLNEISASWQMNKLLIGLKVDGWSGKLSGSSLDKRRDDKIFGAENAKEAIEILNRKISYYQIRTFKGVKNPRLNKSKAEEIIKNNFSIDSELTFLGKGSEGFVFTDKKYIFKLIDNSLQSIELYWTLMSLSEKLNGLKGIEIIPDFEVTFSHKRVLIKYKFEKTDDYVDYTDINIDKFIILLKQFKKLEWTLTDFKPQNLRVKKDGSFIIVDLGKSFLPASDYLFKSMCRRAFVTYKLQGKIQNPQDYKKYLSPVNESANFSLMREFGYSEQKLKQQFNEFYQEIITVNKKDVLNPILSDIFQSQIKVKDVFDYGSGYGDISKMLLEKGLLVTAYEPDNKIVQKYKEKYYKNINIVNYEEMQEIISKKKDFDSVLCSLVLCHPLADTKEKRLKIIEDIMKDITALSNKYVVIVVCNPLYTSQIHSSLQKRVLPDLFNYSKETEFAKIIYSSSRERYDIHRPLSFYENLFEKYNLKIQKVFQTNDQKNNEIIQNSDFMIFVLKKK